MHLHRFLPAKIKQAIHRSVAALGYQIQKTPASSLGFLRRIPRRSTKEDALIRKAKAHLIESEMPEARRYQPLEIAGEFSRSLERELDLAIEARNLERIGASFEGDPHIVIPKVYREWTSEIMNVQQHIDGIPGTDLANEIVILGAHLDSWDPGVGALDDGAGVAIMMGVVMAAAICS